MGGLHPRGAGPAGLDAIGWAVRCQELGAGELVLNSMDRDGTREGYDLELTRRVVDETSIPIVASGGVGASRTWSTGPW